MNLILLDREEPEVQLTADDLRAQHIRKVLRARIGEVLDVGVPMGPLGRATVLAVDADGVTLRCQYLSGDRPARPPVLLLLGMIRPIEGRRLLEDAAAAGVATVHAFPGDRTAAGYATSSAWSEPEAQAALRRGASQGFTTWVPAFQRHPNLDDALRALPPSGSRIVLDVYEATQPLMPTDASPPADTHSGQADTHSISPADTHTAQADIQLAIGPERGWSAAERERFRAAGWVFRHLGPRVLRTSHALHAALALLAANGPAQRSHLDDIRRLRNG